MSATIERPTLESDVLVTYMDTQANQDQLLGVPSVAALPQVEHGTTAQIIGEPLAASVGPHRALADVGPRRVRRGAVEGCSERRLTGTRVPGAPRRVRGHGR